MSDISGSRFLQRFAGSNDFQQELGRSSNPKKVNNDTDFTYESGSFDYSPTEQVEDNSHPNTLRGPGSFSRQVEREKYIDNNNVAQGGNVSSKDFMNRYISMNRKAQAGQGDGSSIANKYIQQAAETNPIDVNALDKHIRRTPLYSEAKSKIEGLNTYGDMYKYGREALPGWTQPASTKAVETPDFGAFYDKTKKHLDSIEIQDIEI